VRALAVGGGVVDKHRLLLLHWLVIVSGGAVQELGERAIGGGSRGQGPRRTARGSRRKRALCDGRSALEAGHNGALEEVRGASDGEAHGVDAAAAAAAGGTGGRTRRGGASWWPDLLAAARAALWWLEPASSRSRSGGRRRRGGQRRRE
jgi:hypothetical protein